MRKTGMNQCNVSVVIYSSILNVRVNLYTVELLHKHISDACSSHFPRSLFL